MDTNNRKRKNIDNDGHPRRCFVSENHGNSRAAPTTTSSGLHLLNQYGISYMMMTHESGRDNSDFDEAERCFKLALSALLGNNAEKYNRRNLQYSSCPTKTHQKQVYEKSNVADIFNSSIGQETEHPTEHHLKSGSPSVSSKSDTKPTKHPYDHDEGALNDYIEGFDGMYAYRIPQTLSNDATEMIIVLTLTFNIGQTHIQRSNYITAKEWLDYTCDICVQSIKQGKANVSSSASVSTSTKTTDTTTETAILMKSLHALGFCSYRQGQYQDALNYYEQALQVVQYHNLGYDCIGISKNALAVAIFHCNPTDFSRVLSLFKECLDMYLSIHEERSAGAATVLSNCERILSLGGVYAEDSQELATTLLNLGQTYHELKKYVLALQCYKEALKMIQQIDGYNSNHYIISIVSKHIASIHRERNEYVESIRMYLTSLRAGRIAFGPVHSEVASILNKLANVYYAIGDLDKALKSLQDGLHIEEVVHGGLLHPDVPITLRNMAQIHRDKKEFATAYETYSQIYTIEVELYGLESEEVCNTLFHMGCMMYQMKSFASALYSFENVLKILRSLHGNDAISAEIIEILGSIGTVALYLRMYDKAKASLEESLRMRYKILENDHVNVATTLHNLATIQLELGNDQEAVNLFKEALRIFKKIEFGNNQFVMQSLQFLGHIYQERGEYDDALIYLREALWRERERSGSNHIVVGKLLNFIGNIHLHRANVDEMMECFVEATRIYAQHDKETLLIAGYAMFSLSTLHPECAKAA